MKYRERKGTKGGLKGKKAREGKDGERQCANDSHYGCAISLFSASKVSNIFILSSSQMETGMP